MRGEGFFSGRPQKGKMHSKRGKRKFRLWGERKEAFVNLLRGGVRERALKHRQGKARGERVSKGRRPCLNEEPQRKKRGDLLSEKKSGAQEKKFACRRQRGSGFAYGSERGGTKRCLAKRPALQKKRRFWKEEGGGAVKEIAAAQKGKEGGPEPGTEKGLIQEERGIQSTGEKVVSTGATGGKSPHKKKKKKKKSWEGLFNLLGSTFCGERPSGGSETNVESEILQGEKKGNGETGSEKMGEKNLFSVGRKGTASCCKKDQASEKGGRT